MAKKGRKGGKVLKTSRMTRETRTRRASSRGRILGTKVSWLEVGITLAAGYFSGQALQDSGVATMALNNSKVGPYIQDAMNANGKRSGPTLAEMIGIVVGAKGLYDLVEGKKSIALQAELPFAIGTLLGPGGA